MMAGALFCPSEWNRILATALRSFLRLTVLFGPLTLPILMRTEAVIAARGNAPAVGWVSSLCVFGTDLCISGHATCVVFVRFSTNLSSSKLIKCRSVELLFSIPLHGSAPSQSAHFPRARFCSSKSQIRAWSASQQVVGCGEFVNTWDTLMSWVLSVSCFFSFPEPESPATGTLARVHSQDGRKLTLPTWSSRP